VPKRFPASVRRPSATLLVWVGSLTLGLADVLYARLVPGPLAVVDRIALALACVAALLFAGAAVRGLLGSRGAAWATAPQPGGPGDAVTREAAWGIVQLEAWLHRQDRSRDG